MSGEASLSHVFLTPEGFPAHSAVGQYPCITEMYIHPSCRLSVLPPLTHMREDRSQACGQRLSLYLVTGQAHPAAVDAFYNNYFSNEVCCIQSFLVCSRARDFDFILKLIFIERASLCVCVYVHVRLKQ